MVNCCLALHSRSEEGKTKLASSARVQGMVVGPLTASMGLMVETPHKVRPYPTAPDPLVDVF
jgi:hypothetical protein